MKKAPSGKFVLRISPELHARLKRLADDRGTSLNELCGNELDSLFLKREGRWEDALVQRIRQLSPQVIGVALFGSAARGDATSSSDVDILVVLAPDAAITRELYARWDETVDLKTDASGKPLSPQFVALPARVAGAGGLWFETALDGRVLWDAEGRLGKFLREIREAIAEGRIVRKVTHGHPYWIKKETVIS